MVTVIMMFKQTIVSWSVASALLVMSGSAAASGFALIEQSASGLGNAFAGGAAAGEDASTIFYNPAGMSRLNGKQITVVGSMIKPSVKFADNGTSAGAASQIAGDDGGDAGSWALVPNAYFAMEVNPQTRVGLGINAPFGLQTEYDSTWIGRFQAIKSKIQTVNLNPSVSYDINETVSLGAGLNYQRIKGDLTSAANYAGGVYGAVFGATGSAFLAGAAAVAVNAAGEGEGLTTVSGDDAQWGYNLGLLFKATPQTRIGLAYRSTIKYDLSGSVSFPANRPTTATLIPTLGAGFAAAVATGIAAATADGPVNLAIKMPDSFSASVFHQLNDKWDIMADATWTGWSVFQQIQVVRSSGAVLQTVPENWKNTWRVSVGANHHYNEQWTARAGLAYDQTPTSDPFRTARIPDGNRTWLSLGGQYKPNRESAVNFGYAHLFVSDAAISQNQTAAGAGTLNGTYSDSVDILSVQYAYSF
jgi:long-chain fatty acid transport protein